MKLLLWDIDLTLIKTGGAGIRSLNHAFEEVFGWENALESVTPQGKTDPAIIREVCLRHGVGEDSEVSSTVESILVRYVEYLSEEVAGTDNYAVLPGVTEVLDSIRDRDDVTLGLATGNIEEGARIKLERGGLNPYFAFGGFGRISERRVDVVRDAVRQAGRWTKREFLPEDTFVIGDTPLDVEAGHAAGFGTIAVATGSFTFDDLVATGADLVIENFSTGRDQFMRSTRIA